MVTSLSDSGVPPQDIQIVTGHKRIETIEHYNKKVNISKRIRLSHKLTNCVSNNEMNASSVADENVCVAVSSSTEDLKHPVAVLEKDGLKLSFYM